VSESPKALLARHGLRPKKSWGQNFLADEHALGQIAAAAQLGSGQTVVELGAGLGHLTRHLLETGARVVAVERDRDMVKVLGELTAERLRVVAADAAQADFAALAETSPTVVVGNLPYHLTSPILFSVLDQHRAVSRAVFTVQREVAERIAAPPGGRDYGLLSVLLGLHFRVEELFVLPARAFHPPPKVESAVVRLTALAEPRAAVASEARFRKLVKAGFGQRRKTLLNALKSDPSLGSAEALVQALATAGIEPTRRAETLSVEEFARLERALPA
jgi:16S rRNA (adenine1518-N6/adenine1519-N6)-dimethyltransferase